MEVTLFRVRFVFQQQGDDKGNAEGDDHPDNVVQQRTGLHDSHAWNRRQADRGHIDVHGDDPCAARCAADQRCNKRLHKA